MDFKEMKDQLSPEQSGKANTGAEELHPNEMEAVSGGSLPDVIQQQLEKLLECKQGKHDWNETIEGEYQPDGAYLFRKVYTCKVCGHVSYGAWDIKRD